MKPVIIIIDDDEIDRYLARRVIQDCDAAESTIELSDGADMVALLDEPTGIEKLSPGAPLPYLVLLDINMPISNGFDVLQKLEGWRSTGEADSFFVVVMLTSSANETEIARAESYSCVRDFVVKPITEERLRGIVDTHYKGSSTVT